MTAPLLPAITSEDGYLAVTEDPDRRRGVAEALAARHGFALREVRAFPGGSLLVLDTGAGRVIKLYSPLEPEDSETEVAALRAIEGRLPVETPRILATGEIDGWPYLVMTRLPGQLANGGWVQRRPVDEPWRRIPRADQLRVAEEVGRAVAALHGIPTGELPDRMRPDWSTFVAAQRETCVARMKTRGLGDAWLEQLPGFLDSVDLRPPAEGVLLHTEIMRDHVLVEERADGWRLSGILDFEPAMIGDPEYELASVAVFLTGGDFEAFRAFLRGYGLPASAQTPDLARRVLAYLLLHRYGNLAWHLELLPEHREATTLDALAAAWWPFGTD
jgi:hygromycin-B 7''-O-kinase